MSVSINELSIEKLPVNDYQELMIAMKAAYPNWQGSYWSLDALSRLIMEFHEGQVVIKANGKVVGCALSIPTIEGCDRGQGSMMPVKSFVSL